MGSDCYKTKETLPSEMLQVTKKGYFFQDAKQSQIKP